MHLFFDPVVLAVPRHDDTGPAAYAEALDTFTRYLIGWKDEFRHKTHCFFTSAECIDALYEDKSFPEKPAVRHCLSLAELTGQYSPEEVTRIALQLATNVPYLEDYFPGIDLLQVEVDENAFFIHPDLMKRLSPVVATALKRSLARIAWLRAGHYPVPANAPNPAELLLATHPIDEAKTSTVRADVLADDFITVESELPLITDPHYLAGYLSLAELWRQPEQAVAWKHALYLMADYEGKRVAVARAREALAQAGDDDRAELTQALRELRRKAAAEAPALCAFDFGPDFVDSLIENEFDRPGHATHLDKTYALCAEILTFRLRVAAQAHRAGEKGSGGIRVGRWEAFRAYINDDDPGYRLLYWKSDRNEFRFVKVAAHDKMDVNSAPRE